MQDDAAQKQTLLGADELVLNMGPQHPSTHGVLRVKLKLDGERVRGTECVIGYLHRGVEKIAENRSYQQFARSRSRSHGACVAVEVLEEFRVECVALGAVSDADEAAMTGRGNSLVEKMTAGLINGE